MITWITEKVAIGEYTDACNREALLEAEIDCILNLRTEDAVGEFILCQQNNIMYFQICVGTDEKHIKRELWSAFTMLNLLAEKYKKVLIHCTAGLDRAPFVVALYLANMELEHQGDYPMPRTDLKYWMIKAYKFIKGKRPQIREHVEWVK